MESIKTKVVGYICENNLLDETNKVYVATSGGADSMALLAFMQEYKDIFNIDVAAVHVNHGMRAETADRDAKFVEEYCKKNKIEFVMFNAKTDGTVIPEHPSEDWGRNLRYGYFKRLELPGVKVATAHTLSDQLETVLFRMARGSGIKGLCGIAAKRDNYIRPMLCLTRSEIEQLVDVYGTSNITDESNLTDDYARNKIRHHVVPVLKGINVRTEESVGKLCARVSKIYEFISREADKALAACEVVSGVKYKVSGFTSVDDAILDEMIIKLLNGLNVQGEQFVDAVKLKLNRIRETPNTEESYGGVELNDWLNLVVTNRYITVMDNSHTPEYSLNTVDSAKGSKTAFAVGHLGYGLDIEAGDNRIWDNVYANKFELCNFADMSKIDLSKCTLRLRAPGDRFKPARKVGGKLGKFIKFIPIAERYNVPVIECDGQVIWVWGVGFTDGFAPDADTQDVYRFIPTWSKDNVNIKVE